MPIAVTGTTGTVGGLTARALAARHVPVRQLVRDPARALDVPGDVRPFAFGDHAATVAALEGVETVLMISAHESDDRVGLHRDFVESAVEAGVRHLVYTSFVNASATSGFLLGRDHGATEEIIGASGLQHTLLRDNFYLEALAGFAGEDGAIRGPAGEGRVAAVSQQDVAAVAAVVLAEAPAHAGRTYDLTGSQALTLAEVAAAVGAATGRDITFVDETMDEARASRSGYDAPAWLVDAWISTYTAIRDGELEHVSSDVERLLGRPALQIGDVLGVDSGRPRRCPTVEASSTRHP